MTDAHTASQAYREYIETRVRTAPPVEIVHWLYQVATDNLNAAIACLKSGDNTGRSRAVAKTLGAINELMFALDRRVDAPFSRNLVGLYDYIRSEINVGHTRRSERAFQDALRVLSTLSEGWSGVRTRVLGDDEAARPEAEPELAAVHEEVSDLFSAPVATSGRDWSC
jgi:flagellar protein FliS